MSKYDGLGLTDEEISAMEEDLTEGEQVEGDDAEVVEEDEPKEDEDTPDVDEDGAGEAEPEKVDDESEPEAKPVEKSVEKEDPAPAPQVPSKVDELKAELAAVKKKFDDGELSVDEYIEARADVDRAIVKAELKAELASDKVADNWKKSQKDFLSQNTYLRDNTDLYDVFAMQVNKLLASPEGAAMSDDDLLAAAKEKVNSLFKLGSGPEPSKKKDESPVRDAKKEAADRSKAPKTLQGVPSAAPADDVDQSPFAYLDRLSGDKLEAALSKLSDEDQTRWAHSR